LLEQVDAGLRSKGELVVFWMGDSYRGSGHTFANTSLWYRFTSVMIA